MQAGVVEGVAHTVQTVFLIGVPIAFVAFLLSWLLPELPLRRSIRTDDAAEGLAMPDGPDLARGAPAVAIDRVAPRENRAELYRTLAERAGLDLQPRACGCSTGWPTAPDLRLGVGRA